MSPGVRIALAGALAPLVLATGGAGRVFGADAPPVTTLAVEVRGEWREWWRSDRPPAQWLGENPEVSAALRWKRAAPGVRWATMRIAAAGPAWRTKVVVVDVEPQFVRFDLNLDLTPEDAKPRWTIERAPKDALVAFNAGQFLHTMPWGWVVTGGRTRLAPGTGPLSCAVAFDASGAMRWIGGDSLAAPPSGIVTAFQSYPTLLERDGIVPEALRAPGGGVNLRHRDARLALGQMRDGRLRIVLTRFDAVGDAGGAVPIGPTTPEMAALMGALGAARAVMLDGGISSQLLLRESGGRTRRWAGHRKVPLALVVRAR